MGATLPAAATSSTYTLRLRRGDFLFVGVFATLQRGLVVPTQEGYAALQYALRDIRAGKTHSIDLRLGVLLCELSEALGKRTIIATSGYRSPATNASTDGAAQNSRHMYGDGVDCYVDGCSNEQVFLAAAGCSYAGGLGLYDDHVHADTWRTRTW